MNNLPDDYYVYEIKLPDEFIIALNPPPSGWDNDEDWTVSQEAGERLLHQSRTLAFKVPSVCDPKAFNYILNPSAANYRKVQVADSYPFSP